MDEIKIGDGVLIIKGEFHGYTGKVLRIENNNAKILLLIDDKKIVKTLPLEYLKKIILPIF